MHKNNHKYILPFIHISRLTFLKKPKIGGRSEILYAHIPDVSVFQVNSHDIGRTVNRLFVHRCYQLRLVIVCAVQDAAFVAVVVVRRTIANFRLRRWLGAVY